MSTEASANNAERRAAYYDRRRPAAEGNVVTQGDVDYCAATGHLTWRADGVDKGECPRCGATVDTYPRGATVDTYPRGATVDYFHVASRTWKPATVESYSPGANAYVLRRPDGRTDMSTSQWTRRSGSN